MLRKFGDWFWWLLGLLGLVGSEHEWLRAEMHNNQPMALSNQPASQPNYPQSTQKHPWLRSGYHRATFKPQEAKQTGWSGIGANNCQTTSLRPRSRN